MASRKHRNVLTQARPPAVAKTARDLTLPANYHAFLEELKARISTAQVKAALAVNRELIQLYWNIGRDVILKEQAEGWGSKLVERLADDLQQAFPGLGGYSRANVFRMRAFFLAYAQEPRIVAQPVRQLTQPLPTTPVRKRAAPIVAQLVRQLKRAILPAPVAEIPWGHNIVLLQKLKDPVARLWYARQTSAQGWSRAMLTHRIESNLFARQGKAVTNFLSALPAPQSDLAHELLKDPYNFDFLTLRQDAAEHELEQGLLNHIRKFLVEPGAGFAFVGQQVHLEIEEEDFYLDLLFYHLRLRCYVVIDLKVVPFKPEFAGKMNFYLSAVDDLLRHPDDKPSIGLILCKSHKRTIAEYALRDQAKPVGVAKYITKLVESLPKELASALPTTQQIRDELDADGAANGNRRTVDPTAPHKSKSRRRQSNRN